MSENLEMAFERAMYGVYTKAKSECNYNARIFRQMLDDRGGVGTAKRLLDGYKIHYGLRKLNERGRLDISMEAEIWDNPKWHRLFTDSELKVAEWRLRKLGYFGDN